MALSYVGLVLLPKDQFLLLQVCFNGVISFAGLFNVGIVKHTQTVSLFYLHI
jgi:hypothetical protein